MLPTKASLACVFVSKQPSGAALSAQAVIVSISAFRVASSEEWQ
jgi:hypothetical protein